MNNLTNTAKKLDRIFEIAGTVLGALAVAAGVFIVLAGLGYVLNWDPEFIGTGYHSVELGCLKLEIADPYVPDARHIFKVMAAMLVLSLVVLLGARLCINCIRQILRPMVENMPFDGTVADNLKKLAKYSLIYGIAFNVAGLLSNIALVRGYDLDLLIMHEKINRAEFVFSFDPTLLVMAAVFLLLSYVFRYGTELQQLSDETL